MSPDRCRAPPVGRRWSRSARMAARKRIAAGWSCGRTSRTAFALTGWPPSPGSRAGRCSGGWPVTRTADWPAWAGPCALTGAVPASPSRCGSWSRDWRCAHRPRPAAHVHRQVTAVAEREGWPVPSYSSVYVIIRGIDPGMATLAHEGSKRYRGGVRPGEPPRGRQAEPDLAGRPHPAGPVGAHPVRQAGPTVADPDRRRPLPRGRRVHGQPRRPLGDTPPWRSARRSGASPGPAGTCAASRTCSTSTTARTSPPRTWSR